MIGGGCLTTIAYLIEFPKEDGLLLSVWISKKNVSFSKDDKAAAVTLNTKWDYRTRYRNPELSWKQQRDDPYERMTGKELAEFISNVPEKEDEDVLPV